MLGRLMRLGELKEAIKDAMEENLHIECEYCGKHFGSKKTLEMHQDGHCLKKRYAEDLYAFPGDEEEIDKGIVEVEGWTTVEGNTAEKIGSKCSFCFKTIDTSDEVVRVAMKEETEELFHNWCAKEQQRIDGDRDGI